ncbi:MAG: two-component regulator propeller domain-containing protein [Ferruginibacter sp.]|nr:two-component regulator propeller domain-containing protein [Ferruginibacter sp.]
MNFHKHTGLLRVAVFVLLALIALRPGLCFATDSVAITHLGIEEGLSNNSVRCIYQDHNGFMWFGTYDGLNRYDGYDFKVFRNKINDTTSLAHNYINAIGEDRQNNLWIGTGQGISIYNNLTSKFRTGFYVPYHMQQKVRIPFNINSIRADAKGNMFIGTNDGGLLVQREGADVAFQVPCAQDLKGICRDDVQSLVIDKQQRVWLFIRELGLCLYNDRAKIIQVINREVTEANCMVLDDAENLWIGTPSGLYKFNLSTQTFQTTTTKVRTKVIVSLTLDRLRNLWVGTEGGGIHIVNPATGDTRYVSPREKATPSVGEEISAIYEDNESRKWVGILKSGLHIIDPQKNKFQTISHDPLSPNSLVSNLVSAFYEGKEQRILVGTDNAGFSSWDRDQNRFTNYSHREGDDRSLSHNSVPSFLEDHLGNLWLATFGGGINKFNPSTGTFIHYPCINQVTGEVYKYAWTLYEDRDRNLWASTYGNGRLFLFNRATNRFEVFCQDPVDIYSLAEDRQGTLWAGTPYGLFKVDKQNKTYIRYEITKPVRAIHQDKKGNLWLGTEGLGLILFDAATGQAFKRYTDAEGLCNNSVLTILEDDIGHLWLSTFHGLSRFDLAQKTFKNFYQEDGLQSNQFSYNAALRLRSGEMVFGGVKGFNIFNPNNIQTRNYNPVTLITGLRINNAAVAINNQYISSFNGDKIAAVSIPYNEAILSFDYAALEYSAPGKISYAYYLEGWDKSWNYSGNLRTATYTKLSEGTYTLRIKATNAEGIWNPQEVRLKVVVLPPWYRTWWAYAFYIFLAAGAIVLYQRYRTNQARLAYEIRLAKLSAEKERAERETERIINETEKEINEKRLSFFTNISHEFRTPLTLISNPIKELLQRAKEDDTQDAGELNLVYRNARRLLSLVDQLLLFRKADTGVDQLRVTHVNFSSLCQEVFHAFVHQAKALNIGYRFRCDSENLELYVDREKIEIVLYNLISNALKYTPTGGQILMSVNDRQEDVEVTVSDNGYGIPKETGDKLFDRFYQVQQAGVPYKAGFGIGLYLVKQFIDGHKGKIFYESKPNEGTKFFIQLLKGKEHLGPQLIEEDSQKDAGLLSELVEGQEPGISYLRPTEKAAEMESLIHEQQSLLVVDDDKQMKDYIAQVFREKFTVHVADTGKDGLLLATKYLPDLVISDVKMPGFSGIDFCKSLKADPALNHIPVILLTAESSLEARLRGVEGGADDYITKPFEKELLVARVLNLLKSRSSLQHYFYNEITLQKNPLKISAEYKEFLERCIAVVEQHLDDENFNVGTLASALGMSHSNLYKKVKSISGQSVNGFIRFIRLRKAAELLINTDTNVNEAATRVGFNSSKYFREQFAKLFGINPSEYIKKYKKAFGKSFHLNQDGYKRES